MPIIFSCWFQTPFWLLNCCYMLFLSSVCLPLILADLPQVRWVNFPVWACSILFDLPGTGTNSLNGKSLSSESHNLILIFFFFSVHQWSLIVSWIQWTFSYVFPLSISLLFLNPDSHVVFCDTSQPPCYYSFFIVPLVLGVKLPEKSPAPEPEPRLQPCPHASSPAPTPLALLPHLQPCPLYSNSSIFLPLQRFFFSQDSENNYVFSLLRLSPLLSSSLKIHLFPRSENI